MSFARWITFSQTLNLSAQTAMMLLHCLINNFLTMKCILSVKHFLSNVADRDVNNITIEKEMMINAQLTWYQIIWCGQYYTRHHFSSASSSKHYSELSFNVFVFCFFFPWWHLTVESNTILLLLLWLAMKTQPCNKDTLFANHSTWQDTISVRNKLKACKQLGWLPVWSYRTQK